MLKSTTKKARENIKSYILQNFNPENYAGYPDEFCGDEKNFDDVKKYILKIFRKEYCTDYKCVSPENAKFYEWASGLPCVLDCRYFYNRSAVADLGDILEETEEEKKRFDEMNAENMLTWLIYRELTR